MLNKRYQPAAMRLDSRQLLAWHKGKIVQIWTLVAHHENSERSLDKMKKLGRIAIGWSSFGDLGVFNPEGSKDISSRLKKLVQILR